MIDHESIITRLDKLKEYVGYLKANQDISLAKLKKDHILQGAVCRYFQLAIECVTDIAELLISSLRLRKPKDAHEAIEVLAENKIIPARFSKRFAPISGFRNILVHEYLEIDLKKVHKHLKEDLQDFDFYAKCIAQYIKSKEYKK